MRFTNNNEKLSRFLEEYCQVNTQALGTWGCNFFIFSTTYTNYLVSLEDIRWHLKILQTIFFWINTYIHI